MFLRFSMFYFLDLLITAILNIKMYWAVNGLWNDWFALGFLMGWIFIGLVVCMCPATVLWMCLCKPKELDPESLPRFVDEASNGLKRES